MLKGKLERKFEKWRKYFFKKVVFGYPDNPFCPTSYLILKVPLYFVNIFRYGPALHRGKDAS